MTRDAFKALFGETVWGNAKQEVVTKAVAPDPKEVARVALALDEAADKLLELLGLQDPDGSTDNQEPDADEKPEPGKGDGGKTPPPPPNKQVADRAGKVAKARAAAALWLENQE